MVVFRAMTCLICLAGFVGTWPMSLAAQNHGPQALAVKKLQKRISVSWNSADLQGVLQNLAANQELPIFLDRRIDPGTPINLKRKQVAVGTLVYEVAELVDGGVCWLGDVAYIAPRADAANLLAIRIQLLATVAKMPTAAKRKLGGKPLAYPRLTEPNELLNAELKSLGLQPESIEKSQLPHDLWAAGQFPSMRAIDRLLLLGFGFGQMPKLGDDPTLPVTGMIPVTEMATAQLTLSVSRSMRRVVEPVLQESFSGQYRFSGNRVTAEGDPMSLYRIERAARLAIFAIGKPTGISGTDIFSGRLKGSIGSALATAADKLGVELKYNSALRQTMLKQIDVMADRLTPEELIQLVLKGTDLQYSIEGKVLLIDRKCP